MTPCWLWSWRRIRIVRSPVRDRLLREAGYTILRFPRADAQSNLSSVIATIRAVLEDRKV